MKRPRGPVGIAIGGLVAVLALSRAWAGDGGAIAGNGTPAGAPACASCHGDDGGGSIEGGFPRLAGITVGYLLHQLDSFDVGSRQNEIMGPIASALTPDERLAVAAYYAGLSVPKAADASAPEKVGFARGQTLAQTGDWPKGLPGCGQCHGAAGQGVGAAFPALAGQPASYLASQLSAWRAGTRHNDPLGLMAGIANRLSDGDGEAVAAFYAALPAPHAEGVR